MPRTVTDHDHRYASVKISSDSEEEENPGPASVTSFYVGRCGFRNCKFETTSSESFSKVSVVGIVFANCSQQNFVYFRLSAQL